MSDLQQALAVYGFHTPAPRQIECAGIAYECNLILDRLRLGLHAGPAIKETRSSCSSTNSSSADLCQDAAMEEFMDKDDEKYHKYVSRLDPNDFKEQDHYRVLGLSKLRYKATMGQIKTAYRQKVLVYHPDKGKATREGSRNEAIFACIQKAYEVVGLDQDKRRSYDSVDPKFDDSAPEAGNINEQNFYEVMEPFFKRHSRFSTVSSVPQLGNADSSREDVERFYDFWFNFKSWREFSYKDTEDKSKGEDRWERREIEKMNRIEREQLRKKYLKKLSATVELAYERDPRVAYFRDADKQRKQDLKERKRVEKQRLVEEREAEERRKQAELEAERLRIIEDERRVAQEKQKAKRLLQTNRKCLRELVQAKQYFTDDTTKQFEVMTAVERICMEADVDTLKNILTKLGGVEKLTDAMELLLLKIDNPSKLQQKQTTVNSLSSVGTVVWEQDELLLLIKATNIYPAGSIERWAQVTKYINDHSKTGAVKPKTEKEIIKEVKRIKSAEASAVIQSAITFVVPTPTNNVEETISAEEAWSASQQKQLETALKSTDSKDPQRWDKIAAAVEGKTKRQCVQRYKHLVQVIKQKKEK